MDSGIDTAVHWGALLLGVALSIPYVLAVFLNRINEPMFANAINKVLGAGDFARTKRLLAAANAPIAVATGAALATVIDGSVLRRDEAEDYRTAGATLDPVTVKQRLTRSFVRSFDESRRALVWRRALAALGAVFVALVLADTIRRQLVAPPMIGAGLALLVLASSVRRDATERGAALAMFASIQDTLYARAMDPNAAAAQTPLLDAKAVLVIEEPGSPPREYALAEPVIKVGRAPNSHVQLAHPDIARMHAVIENDEGSYSIIDLGSSAGTQVNGQPINKRALHDGDRITVGPCTLVVRIRG